MQTVKKSLPLSDREAWKGSSKPFLAGWQETFERFLFRRFRARRAVYAEAEGIFLDYSKNRVNDETLKLLVQLAEESGLREKIEAMFRGDKINITENRAVLHVALRAPKGESIVLDGEDVVLAVHAVLDKMSGFADRVRSGAWKGAHGQADQERRQHRDRRIGPGAGDGV